MSDASPRFVFKGTVRSRGSTAGTYAVTVDDVIESPKQLADLAGQTVDLEPDKGARLSTGVQRVFHTVPVRYGESLVVRSVKPAKAEKASALEPPVTRADLIVSGKVRSLKDVQDPGGPVTEHAPRWRDAVVDVDDVLKGRFSDEALTVRYPASSDVLWYDVPELRVGSTAIFLLHRQRPARKGGRPEFTAIVPGGVQSLLTADAIRRLVSPS